MGFHGLPRHTISSNSHQRGDRMMRGGRTGAGSPGGSCLVLAGEGITLGVLGPRAVRDGKVKLFEKKDHILAACPT